MLRTLQTPARPADGFLAYRAEDDLLRLEIHHRLMNTFMILSTLLQRECSAPEPCGRSALVRSIRVVRAHADLHQLLASADRVRDVDAAEHLNELCRALSEAALAPRGIRCEAAMDAGYLSGAQCEWLGLVVCELVLNAAKHAFDDDRPGVVRVELTRVTGGWRCAVLDNGRGATVDPAPGLGRHIVDALVTRLNGAITVVSGPSGHRVVIEFPLAFAAGAPEV